MKNIGTNQAAIAEGLRPAEARPVLLGITKHLFRQSLCLSRRSRKQHAFLQKHCIWQRRSLDGLKENVIVGRLIPAGTGAVMNKLRRIVRT